MTPRPLKPYRFTLLQSNGQPWLSYRGKPMAFSEWDFALGACKVRVLRGEDVMISDTQKGDLYDVDGNAVMQETMNA